MIRCPYCGSTNTTVLPMGDYLCLDCDEQFYKGERPPRNDRSRHNRILSLVLKKGPQILSYTASVGKVAIPALLKNATIFFL